ncbi:DUF6318 family protein [Kineosporia babensis]|uniref:DUF6318 family protein n=1 Tax=Kineosporia babensis TaxID=499548 RepID=A0A9X1NGP4_9ACTN|nr:DUF6318 family protein [Kineosporia babensis]
MAPAAEKSAKGAEDFVRYFWEVYDYSYSTGNVTPLSAISDSDCVFCEDTVSKVGKLSAANQRVAGAHVEVVAAIAPPSDPSKGLIVVTILNERPSTIVDADGVTVKSQQGFRNMKSEIAIIWRDSQWIVRDLANNEKSGQPWTS